MNNETPKEPAQEEFYCQSQNNGARRCESVCDTCKLFPSWWWKQNQESAPECTCEIGGRATCMYHNAAPDKTWILLSTANEVIESRNQEIARLASQLATLRAEKGKIAEEAWVKVSDRLPDPDKRLPSVSQVVLIHTDKLTPWLGYYDFSIKLWLTTSNVFRNVTHWQPLPKPPSSIAQKSY